MKPQTLKQLMIEAQTYEAFKDRLYRFVSSAHPPYEIKGFESEAITLLINFSAKRSNVSDPLDREEAEDHLAEDNCRLIRRFTKSLTGWHTHNLKFPLSFQRGNLRSQLPYDDSDPYVHSGSVKLSKRSDYSQNAANNKAAKGLLGEFYFHGQLTSMLEEIQRTSSLGNEFMDLISKASANAEYDNETELSPDDELYNAISSLSQECFPDTATDPQIYALTAPEDEELLLSPAPHTGLMREIHLRLQNCEWWMKTQMLVGTGGNEINTYGCFISDTGGRVRVLRSVPPTVVKGTFRTLIDSLGRVGHLYSFEGIRPFFLKMGHDYIEEETGQLWRWTSYRENRFLQSESEKMIRSVFSQYRQLCFYLDLGRKIPAWCLKTVEKSPAQICLTRQEKLSSKAIKQVIKELMPLLNEKLKMLAADNGLPFTEHHQKVIHDAISNYFRRS